MKTKNYTTLATLVLSLVTINATTPMTRAQEPGEPHRLEGAWAMAFPGTPLAATFILAPSDATSTRATISGNSHIGDPTLMGAFTNAQYQTPLVGEAVLTNATEGVFTVLQYGMKMGPALPEIVYIIVDSGTFKMTGPAKTEHNHLLSVYLPQQDGDGDGLPDAGQAPIACIPMQSIDTRIGIIPPCTPPPPPGPSLNISRQAGNTLSIAWPESATGFTLQSTPSLPATNWVPVPGVQSNHVTITPAGEKQFYRLEQQ